MNMLKRFWSWLTEPTPNTVFPADLSDLTETMTFEAPKGARHPGRGGYPWDEWFDGRQHTLVYDRDFHGRPKYFIRTLKKRVEERGGACLVLQKDDDTLVIQYTDVG